MRKEYLVWQDAMKSEIASIEKNATWELVDLPIGKNVVGTKWIYEVKYHSDGTVEKHKARLVAKGFSQEEGIDYEEIFALIAKMTTIRAVMFLLPIMVGQITKWMSRWPS